MRTVAYCGDYTALTTTKWGAKIYVDTRDTSLAPHIMIEGDWEPWVTNAIVTSLQAHKGCLFIDVGANVGWYTLLASGLGAGHVFAFEPNPRMVELLKKTIAVNGLRERVTLTQAACGSEKTKAHLIVDPAEVGGGHIVPASYEQALGEALDGAPRLCGVVRLDDVLDQHGYEHGHAFTGGVIVKIDVEGFEPEVLAGASKLLELRPLLYLEHNRASKHAVMYRMLQELDYELRHVRHNGYCSEPLSLGDVMQLADAETVFCSQAVPK